MIICYRRNAECPCQVLTSDKLNLSMYVRIISTINETNSIMCRNCLMAIIEYKWIFSYCSELIYSSSLFFSKSAYIYDKQISFCRKCSAFAKELRLIHSFVLHNFLKPKGILLWLLFTLV